MTDLGDVEFRILHKIGQGSFGKIYVVEDPSTNKQYAMKLENFNVRVPQVLFEGQIYNLLAGGPGIPNVYAISSNNEGNYIVIDLLGKSLESLLNICHRKMSLKTVLMLADQMLTSIEFMHSKGFIHRDIKPDNFIMGLGQRASKVFLIDFGLSKRYKDPRTGTHYPYREGLSLSGTARYASIPALTGVEQSRRDDLEGLAYVLIYLLKGSLPWQGIDCADKREKHYRIAGAKIGVPLNELCNGIPDEFQRFLTEVRNLEYDATPQYEKYREMFRKLFISKGYKYDNVYDWDLSEEDREAVTVASSCSSSHGAVPPKMFHKRHHFAVDSNDSRAANTMLEPDSPDREPDPRYQKKIREKKSDAKHQHHHNVERIPAIKHERVSSSRREPVIVEIPEIRKKEEKLSGNSRRDSNDEHNRQNLGRFYEKPKKEEKLSGNSKKEEKTSGSSKRDSNNERYRHDLDRFYEKHKKEEKLSGNSKKEEKSSGGSKRDSNNEHYRQNLERFYEKPKKEEKSSGNSKKEEKLSGSSRKEEKLSGDSRRNLDKFYEKPKKERHHSSDRTKRREKSSEPSGRHDKFNSKDEHDAILKAVSSLQKFKEEGLLDEEEPIKQPHRQPAIVEEKERRRTYRHSHDKEDEELDINKSSDLRKLIRKNIKMQRQPDVIANSTPIFDFLEKRKERRSANLNHHRNY